jgi:hypothetical protein
MADTPRGSGVQGKQDFGDGEGLPRRSDQLRRAELCDSLDDFTGDFGVGAVDAGR